MNDTAPLSTAGGRSTPGQQAPRNTDQDTATAQKQLTCASVHQELTEKVADASAFRQHCQDKLTSAEKALSLAHSSFNGEWHGPRTIVDYALTNLRDTVSEWQGHRDQALKDEREARKQGETHMMDHGPESKWETVSSSIHFQI